MIPWPYGACNITFVLVSAVTHMLDKQFFSNGAPDICNEINRRQITEFLQHPAVEYNKADIKTLLGESIPRGNRKHITGLALASLFHASFRAGSPIGQESVSTLTKATFSQHSYLKHRL